MALERRLKLVTTGMPRFASETPVKVAFATSDMKRVNQHFGTAESFAVYDLRAGQARLAEVLQFDAPGGGERAEVSGTSLGEASDSGAGSNTWGHSESKLAAKIDALQGCIAIYCQAVGASAIKQLHLGGIQAIKVASGTEIRGLLETLQTELAAGAKGWLGQAIARRKPRSATRFDDMEREDGSNETTPADRIMIEESARVVSVAPGLAWVETSRRSACGGCSASRGCGTSVVSQLFATRQNRFQVSDPIGVEVNDQVVIGIAESTLTQASLLAYLLPLVLLILSAYAAESTGAGEAVSALAGILGVGLGLWITGRLTNVGSWSERSRPLLLRRSGTPAFVAPPMSVGANS